MHMRGKVYLKAIVYVFTDFPAIYLGNKLDTLHSPGHFSLRNKPTNRFSDKAAIELKAFGVVNNGRFFSIDTMV